jgi:hypothetical protein
LRRNAKTERFVGFKFRPMNGKCIAPTLYAWQQLC